MSLLTPQGVKDLISAQPFLVQAIIAVESAGNPRAVSSQGAKGLMQLMPAICRYFKVEDPFDPVDNIRGGTLLLREELARFGHPRLALAAYNAGSPSVVKAIRLANNRSWDKIKPFLRPQTQEYVPKVMLQLLNISAKAKELS